MKNPTLKETVHSCCYEKLSELWSKDFHAPSELATKQLRQSLTRPTDLFFLNHKHILVAFRSANKK